MGREEQIEEREVLDSIFPDEITDISETEYRISITLDLPDDESEPPIILLTIRYPEDYPDKAPLLELAAPQGSSPHQYINVAEDKDQLLQGLEATVEENLGMAMVFTLVSAVKEAAEQLVEERKAAAAKEHEEAVLAAEREENKKFHGTPVNRDTFLKWREDFLKEMEENRVREEEERLAELKKARIKEPVKLTGKQLWERGLATAGQEDGDDDGVPTDDVQKLKVGDN
ncbi:ubiquitin-conjugating enzyme/RWD-like protein [Chaetomium sp. MPI-SDFR-AT-0129]|uniref:Ubiquitin-conjugating enzyme/RWD-like protein n=1 Tax=Dichotomopilus funicola TaxID=1934379 RepID=A0AAN6V4J4_9PEZI|nr:ubiquitin-conjugating enzyme/RWD-like protein [Chaetomium sp. MPI-SDFR-AT-0129]KAK4144640.1 ubiquitin-conjugating enzyme/RWD-like protein [Dichotomopilus funicola]